MHEYFTFIKEKWFYEWTMYKKCNEKMHLLVFPRPCFSLHASCGVPYSSYRRSAWQWLGCVDITAIQLGLSGAFTARRSYAGTVLRVVILYVCLSVRPSVCHTMLCDKTKQRTADIFIPHESFLTPTVVDGRRPLSCEICAHVTHRLRNTLTSRDFRL